MNEIDFTFEQMKENWNRDRPNSFFKMMQYIASLFKKLGRNDISKFIYDELNEDTKKVREMLVFTLHYLLLGIWFERSEDWEE